MTAIATSGGRLGRSVPNRTRYQAAPRPEETGTYDVTRRGSQGLGVDPISWVLDVFPFEHPALTRAAAGKPIGRRAVQALVKAYWPYLRQTDFAAVSA